MGGSGHSLRLIRWLHAEIIAEQDRWFLWSAAGFVGGIAVYFILPAEPILGSFTVLSLVLAAVAWRRRHRLVTAFFISLIAMACFGVGCAQWRAHWQQAPVLARDAAGVTVQGWVERAQLRDGGHYALTLLVDNISRISPEKTPKKIRINLRGGRSPPRLGQAIETRAWLTSPRGPVAPGAYDFSRVAYFQQIGAIGTVLGAPKQWHNAPPAPLGLRWTTFIDGIRHAIAARIQKVLPEKNGALAVALLTGLRDWIPPSTREALRDAGLAHVLAISGMHMSLMAGAIFWSLRAMMALSSSFALRFNIKKIAAGGALIGAALYLLLSGHSVATQRAFVMIAIMLSAMMLGRPAITMRNIAIAAFVVAAFQPEAVLAPGFQMSFAAATALVAFYEIGIGFRGQAGAHKKIRPFHSLAVYFSALSWSSIVASVATGLFIIYHFQRISPFSLLGNLLALPAVGVIIMPAGLFTLLLMPFGLDSLPLMLMGWGISWVISMATWVASLPGSEQLTGPISAPAMAIIVFGGLWLLLWQRRWRLAGIAIIGGGVVISLSATPPDILIGPGAKTLAVRGAEGQLSLYRSGRSTYVADLWLARDGDGRPLEQVEQTDIQCDPLACVMPLPEGGHMALIHHRAALAEECLRAHILVASFDIQRACPGPALVVDRAADSEFGARAIWISQDLIESHRPGAAPGTRPWAIGPRSSD